MLENFRLRVFRTVARQLSFSRAAEELLLTQPAVSQQVRALEQELGLALFDRGNGRIALTDAGRALLPYADRIKALSDEATAAVAAACGQQAGELLLGASQTIAQYLLPSLVAGFLESHPRVHLSVRTGNSEEMLTALLAGHIQLALVEGSERRNDITFTPFLQDRMVLVVPAGHAWAGREIALATLTTQPLLMREFGSGSRRVVEQALAAAGLQPKDLPIRMEFDSTEGLLSAVAAGLGVTFVSRWAVRNQLALGTLKLARVQGVPLRRFFQIASPAGPVAGGSVEAFRAMLLTHAARLTPRNRIRPAAKAGPR